MSSSGASGGGIPVSAEGAAGGVATLDGTGNVPAGQLGNAPAGALPFASGQLAADVAIGAVATDILVTSALAIGKWLITFTVTVLNTDATNKGYVAFQTVAGTATFAVDGPSGCSTTQGPNTTAGTLAVATSFTLIAEVTVAGTIKLQGTKEGSSTALTAKAADNPPVTHASGYVAVKIA